ncbi:hypothetical protein B0H16DRAFT_679495 [Mycena metata]|uniref:Secreted protein n=1 Tax=Mycena metata TaxID=1033252 RepID=A0AAD7J4U7_9AGAR|nr:hypothetical protein B0H16DRAFT_679495 [Mycena metata]
MRSASTLPEATFFFSLAVLAVALCSNRSFLRVRCKPIFPEATQFCLSLCQYRNYLNQVHGQCPCRVDLSCSGFVHGAPLDYQRDASSLER